MLGSRWFEWFALVALMGGAFVGCGGKSEGTADDGGGSGGGGAGGHGGGSGSGSGGGSGGGSGSGVGGSGGGGICSLPAVSGPCEAAILRYAFDAKSGLCLPFVYGGCQGNANNFESAEACYGECGGQGEIDPVLCERPTDCVLAPSTCCGSCDDPTAWNVVAVRSGQASAVQIATGCNLVDCVPCDAPPQNPWLIATCRAGRCIAIDARETELTECTEPSDCRLRAGLGCCESCGSAPGQVVSVNASVDLAPWLCGDGPVACDLCEPAIPIHLSATCYDMRCTVQTIGRPVD